MRRTNRHAFVTGPYEAISDRGWGWHQDLQDYLGGWHTSFQLGFGKNVPPT